MLIQIRHPVVPDRNMRKKRQRLRVSCAYDESIDLFDRRTIDEMDCAARNVRDRWLLHNVRVLESVVAKVQVWSMAFHNGDDGVSRHTEQVDGYISAGAARVSRFYSDVVLVSTYTEAPTTTTRCVSAVRKISVIGKTVQQTFSR